MPAKVPKRQAAVLTTLVVVLIAVLAYNTRGYWGAGAPAVPATTASRAATPAAPGDRAEPVPTVRLAALGAARPEPSSQGRNLFREAPKAPPVQPPPRVVAPPPDPNAPPPPPPPPPPITLRLVAIVHGPARPIAALTDERDVFYGREGEIIEGRYKIVKINVESIDIAYADGRGQRRLGLTR
jgi:hypothetical protein